MKKIIYLLAVVGLTFTGCDPMEDINKEIDALDNPVVGDAIYTLTDEDYETLELDGSFDSEEDAKLMIPDLLSEMYPVWGNGSSVTVGYNLYIGRADGVSDYTGADQYRLSNSDYASFGSDAWGFYPEETPNDFIPAILDAQITAPVEGQIVLAKYKQYVDQPVVGYANLIEYNFDGDFDGFDVKTVTGAEDVWVTDASYIQASGYNGGAQINEEWLVSPDMDLTDESDLKFQINQYKKYLNGQTQLLKIMVATDYDGDVTTATWEEIVLITVPAGDNDDFVLSENYDFSAYDGETINIAFRYESTVDDAPRWRVDQMAIKTLGVTGETTSHGDYYMYDGSAWELVEGVRFLSSIDFDSMGEESGQPGSFDNFSSSVSPGNYLPQFLSNTYPYAQADDKLFVIYDYYSSSSGAQVRGEFYTFIDGEWLAHESTISTTLQFGFENGVWVPDNTIKYELDGDDYDYMAAELEGNPDFESVSLENLSFYNNYDYNWSQTQILFSLDLLLDHLDPNAEEEQKYLVTYLLYDNGTNNVDVLMIKLDGEWVLKEY